MKFCTRVRLKPSNDRSVFELDRARSRNNIAENSFALGHETHNNENGAVAPYKTPETDASNLRLYDVKRIKLPLFVIYVHVL